MERQDSRGRYQLVLKSKRGCAIIGSMDDKKEQIATLLLNETPIRAELCEKLAEKILSVIFPPQPQVPGYQESGELPETLDSVTLE